MPRVTLIGYRGSGKSAVAAALAERLGCAWCDADAILERDVGVSIADFVAQHGEPGFRDAETAILDRLLDQAKGVLATGGGVILREANRQQLRTRGRPVIWLSASVDVLRLRLAADPTTAHRRPALGSGDVIEEVAAAVAHREPLYREVADSILDTSRESPDRLAERIAIWLEGPRPELIS
jgi:shikimate kinase